MQTVPCLHSLEDKPVTFQVDNSLPQWYVGRVSFRSVSMVYSGTGAGGAYLRVIRTQNCSLAWCLFPPAAEPRGAARGHRAVLRQLSRDLFIAPSTGTRGVCFRKEPANQWFQYRSPLDSRNTGTNPLAWLSDLYLWHLRGVKYCKFRTAIQSDRNGILLILNI